MPEADTFDAPQGGTLYARLLEGVTEAFAGNGITNSGDAEATAGTGMAVNVAAATNLQYAGSSYSPAAGSFTLSNGPTTTTNGEDDRRADLIYFDSSTGAYAVTEGTPDPNPTAPATPAAGLMLAVVSVGNGVTNITNDDILNWRPVPTEAGDVPITDSGGNFTSSYVEGALAEAFQGLSGLDDYDLAGNTVVSGADTVFDGSNIVNGIVTALANFGSTDAFSGYPIAFGSDTEASGYPLSLTTDTNFEQLTTGTFTHTGGDATTFEVPGVTTDETALIDVDVYVDAAAGFAADYAFNVEWSRQWDNANSEVDVSIVVTWDTDPGAGNDLTLRYEVTSR